MAQRNFFRGGYLSALALLSSGMALSAPVAAQEAPSALDDENEGNEVPLITVTARRTTETLLDVPISITVLDQGSIEQLGATSTENLGFAVPNLLLNQNFGNPFQTSLSIRGVGNVGVYIDDVFIGTDAGYQTDLIDVQRIEVLRGPQGTLFGKNTVAGLLNIATTTPGEALKVRGQARYGSFNEWGVAANVSGPLAGDVLGFSLTGSVRQRDGFYEVADGPDGNTEDHRSGRLGLFFEPSPAFSLAIRGDYTLDQPRVFYLEPIRDFFGPGLAAADGDPFDRRIGAQSFPNNSERENAGLSAIAKFNFGDGYELTSVTAKRWTNSFFVRDNDYLEAEILSAQFDAEFESFQQEFRLASPQDQAFRWLIGAFYLETDAQSLSQDIVGSDFPLPFGVTLGEYFELQDVLGLGLPLAAPEFTIFRPNRSKIESIAGFASATYDFSDTLSATAGIRYTEETRLDESETFTSDTFFGLASGVPPVPFDSIETTTDDWSPTVSVNYNPSSSTLLYATWSRGFTSGGANPATAALPAGAERSFAPERMDNFEIGLKTRFLDNRAQLTAAIFRMDYSNLQRVQNVVIDGCPPTGCSLTTNAAEARIQGFEIDLVGRPAAGLQLEARVGYSDAEFREYLNAPFTNLDGTTSFVELSGEPLPQAPKWTFSTGGNYETALNAALKGFLGAQVQYRSSYLIAFGENPLFETEAQYRTSAFIGIKDDKDKWSLTARAFNIFDDTFIVDLNSNAAIGLDLVGLNEPRRFQLDLDLRF